MSDINFNVIFGFIVGALIIVTIVFLWRGNKEVDPVRRALSGFTIMMIAAGVFFIILLLALPSTSVLTTFGYPDIQEIRSPDALLKHLQAYNKALIRTTQVVRWFLVVFIWWFLTTLFWFSRVLATSISKASKNDGQT
jgi:MFS family permease